MPGTVTTNNPGGINKQTVFFSGPVGTPINQAFVDAAFAGRINTNKIYKGTYNEDVLGVPASISTWLDEFMGYETSCYPQYTTLEINSLRQQVRSNAAVTLPASGTGTFTLSTVDHSVGGAYVLPQVGNSLALPPVGALWDISAVTHTGANTTTLTGSFRTATQGPVTLAVGDVAYVLSGSTIEDCGCPVGQFAFEDMPIEHDLKMIHFGDKGELCGDAIFKCQNWLIPFTNERGDVIEERWYNEPLQKMYRRFEDRKRMEDLFNPIFGIIPGIKARGLKFTPTSTTEITTDDVRDFKQGLDIAGVLCREYAIFAGREKFSQFQRMLLSAGVTQLQYSERPLNDCAWINMEYCGIRVEGMTLHIYEETSFSNGMQLGAQGMVFPNSAIWVPMINNTEAVQKTAITTTGLGYKNKLFTRVYFQEEGGGRVWDALTDSNGILNGPGGRNTFGTGCMEHEWTVQTRYLNELRGLKGWGYMGL